MGDNNNHNKNNGGDCTHFLPPNPNFTATMGRERDHGLAAKSLLYGVSPDDDLTPSKRLGRKGVAPGNQTSLAPFAVSDTCDLVDKDTVKITPKKESKEVQTKVGCDLYASEVYRSNRAYNFHNKQESLKKAFSGSGNILSHGQ